MTPRTLKILARQVWGRGWAFELALALGRNPNTIARWRAGLTSPSRADHARILAACLRHSRERHRIVREMVGNAKEVERRQTIKNQENPSP